MPTPRKARVLIVDAEPVSRCGLLHLLDSHARLRVVAEAEDLPRARELCARHKPEVVVLDTAVGDGAGFIREIKRWCAHARVVIFSAHADALSVQRAFQAGASGYVTRRDPVAALIDVVLGAVNGVRRVGPRVENALLERLSCGGVELGGGAETALSDREMQVFRLLGQGLGTRAVAEELGVSVKTVETHRQRIKEKLGVASGVELQRRAVLFYGAAVS